MDGEIVGLAQPSDGQRLFRAQGYGGRFEFGQLGLVHKPEPVPEDRGAWEEVRIAACFVILEGQDLALR
jgi:hypothetical protein